MQTHNNYGVTPPYIETPNGNPATNLTGLYVNNYKVIAPSETENTYKYRSPLWQCKNLETGKIEHIPARNIMRWWKKQNEG